MLLYIPKPRQFTAVNKNKERFQLKEHTYKMVNESSMSTVTTIDRRAALAHHAALEQHAAVSMANLKKLQQELKIIEADLLIAEDLELTKTWELEGAKLAVSMMMNR